MDSFQFWLYVIIGLIYLISTLRKKRKAEESGPEAGNEGRPDTPREERQLTFEELLREITQGKMPMPENKPETVVSRAPRTNYDETVVEEAEDLEDVEYDYRKRDSIYADYEGEKEQAFNHKSLEETWKREKVDVTPGKFKMFEEEEKPDLMRAYLGDMKNLESLKKAFVVSEILKTKF